MSIGQVIYLDERRGAPKPFRIGAYGDNHSRLVGQACMLMIGAVLGALTMALWVISLLVPAVR